VIGFSLLVEVPISNITRYGTVQDGRKFAESITFELPAGNDSVDLSIHRAPDKDSAKIVVTALRSLNKHPIWRYE